MRDALGSTLALTNPAGAVQTSYAYAPFGITTSTGHGWRHIPTVLRARRQSAV